MIPESIAEIVKPLYLRFHTAGRMHPRQITGMAERTARQLFVRHTPISFDRFYERRVSDVTAPNSHWIDANTETLRSCLTDSTRERYCERARGAATGAPTFLNRTLHIADENSVDWYDERLDELPLLWSMKLYAFQPLSWLCLGYMPGTDTASELQLTFDGWILDWIDSVDIGRPGYLRSAWTPWAVSLRLLHWSRYLGWRESESTECDDFCLEFRRELYKNALFLKKHIERDVGGNHLIENGAALVVVGLLFGEQSWVDAGESILIETTEQFLDDGCHFERSPMYHVLTLTRYLTVCELLGESSRQIPDPLQSVTDRATSFLQFIRPPDGRIPLLNDSVYGQALPLRDCLRYAEMLGFGDSGDSWTVTTDESAERISNYHWLRTENGAILIDGGRVGPPHLPGHSHSDTLSTLLWIEEHPIATDTGTFEYVSGPRREYARGVRGHNTVQVDDIEPICVGGKYLMGPRPEPKTRFETGSVSLFEGSYVAAPFSGPKYTHHRAVYAGGCWLVVWDSVRGHDGLKPRNRLHLHPAVSPSLESTGRIRLEFQDETAFVHPLGSTRVGIKTGPYFPRFGVAISRPVLEFHADKTDNTPTIGFLVTQQDVGDVGVDAASNIRNLRVGGIEYQLPGTELSLD